MSEDGAKGRRSADELEHDWLAATQESTRERFYQPAIDKALGEDEAMHGDDDDPVVNGYRRQNQSPDEPPGPENKPEVGELPPTE